MPSLTIIGAGNVGTTLGKCFAAAPSITISQIYSRTPRSAARARAQIGAGSVATSIADLNPADFLLIATTDTALPGIAAALATAGAARPGTIAFHCSGATPSAVLHGLRATGALIASAHPIKTFTSPAADAQTFPGTWCGIEGDPPAAAALKPLFASIGANCFDINANEKLLYHAGSVFMCNYLFPLIEAGMRCYEQAGVDRPTAARCVETILHTTIDNALRDGPAKALTGPIARGDDTTVQNQRAALAAFDPTYARLYEFLGALTTDLAAQKGVASAAQLARLRDILSYDKYVGTKPGGG
jgi:predicted short-subunit dehydrogenase-like oxidoreductase (DUF2520 family)